jgi:anti-sigma-K factor RskA
MTATSELLDRVRQAANIPSDNVLSQKLGITRAVVSGWRNELYPLPDERIAQLCEMAKLDGPVWLARIHAERATSPVERKLWRSMLDKVSAAAAVVALVCVSLPGVANAKPSEINTLRVQTAHILYIM